MLTRDEIVRIAKIVQAECQAKGGACALIGGAALEMRGIPTETRDIDFATTDAMIELPFPKEFQDNAFPALLRSESGAEIGWKYCLDVNGRKIKMDWMDSGTGKSALLFHDAVSSAEEIDGVLVASMNHIAAIKLNAERTADIEWVEFLVDCGHVQLGDVQNLLKEKRGY
jgi:hypothetical protein